MCQPSTLWNKANCLPFIVPAHIQMSAGNPANLCLFQVQGNLHTLPLGPYSFLNADWNIARKQKNPDPAICQDPPKFIGTPMPLKVVVVGKWENVGAVCIVILKSCVSQLQSEDCWLRIHWECSIKMVCPGPAPWTWVRIFELGIQESSFKQNLWVTDLLKPWPVSFWAFGLRASPELA